MPVSSTKQACHWGLLILQMHLGLSKNVLTQLWSQQFEEQNVTWKLVNIVYMCTVYSILLQVCCDILHICFSYMFYVILCIIYFCPFLGNLFTAARWSMRISPSMAWVPWRKLKFLGSVGHDYTVKVPVEFDIISLVVSKNSGLRQL